MSQYTKPGIDHWAERAERVNHGYLALGPKESGKTVEIDTPTQLRIHDFMEQASKIPQISSTVVVLKRPPLQKLKFEVVSEFSDKNVAALYALGLPLKALYHAGIDLYDLEAIHPPTLVSNDREEDPLNPYVEPGLFETVRARIGDLVLDGYDVSLQIKDQPAAQDIELARAA